MDEVHFVSIKQKSQFKLKAQFGPFKVNTEVSKKEVNDLLNQMMFKLSFTWSYDPLGVISSMWIAKKFAPYMHVAKPEIEQYANKED